MTIQVKKFWTNYKPNKEGAMDPVDMVAYCAVGYSNFAVQVAPVSRLSKVLPLEGNEGNPAIVMANDRWQQIKVKYDAWKMGNEIPETGTAIGAWSGINQDMAEAMRLIGLRTVEELAEASEGVIARINMPNMKAIQKQAKAYLSSQDRVAVANELAEKDKQLADMQAEIEEMKKIMQAAAKKPAPRKKADAA